MTRLRPLTGKTNYLDPHGKGTTDHQPISHWGGIKITLPIIYQLNLTSTYLRDKFNVQ